MSVSAKKDSNGTWRIQYRYTDWKGEKKKSQKRGFRTKKEAEEWLQQFLLRQSGNLTMTFSDFWKVYKADMQGRVRESTMIQKEYIVKEKLLPYFGDIPLNEITAPKIRAWQNEMMSKGYKETYLKTINNHLSCIMNYAVRFYDLQSNPCHKAGSMGKSRAENRRARCKRGAVWRRRRAAACHPCGWARRRGAARRRLRCCHRAAHRALHGRRAPRPAGSGASALRARKAAHFGALQGAFAGGGGQGLFFGADSCFLL